MKHFNTTQEVVTLYVHVHCVYCHMTILKLTLQQGNKIILWGESEKGLSVYNK